MKNKNQDKNQIKLQTPDGSSNQEILEFLFKRPYLYGLSQYDYILDMFGCVQHIYQLFLKPFIINEKIYATDAVSMVFFDKNLVRNIAAYYELDDDKQKNLIPTVIPEENCSHHISLDELKACISICPVVLVHDVCEACCESKQVQYEFNFYDKTYTRIIECPVCKNIKDHHSFDSSRYGIIGVSGIAIPRLMELYNIAQILEQDTIELVSQRHPNNANLFKIGNVKILVSPIDMEQNNNAIFKIEL